MKFRSIGLLLAPVPLLVTLLAASEPKAGGWLERVPPSEHAQKSPIRRKAGAIARGEIRFEFIALRVTVKMPKVQTGPQH
jgi:hypothetical protein